MHLRSDSFTRHCADQLKGTVFHTTARTAVLQLILWSWADRFAELRLLCNFICRLECQCCHCKLNQPRSVTLSCCPPTLLRVISYENRQRKNRQHRARKRASEGGRVV